MRDLLVATATAAVLTLGLAGETSAQDRVVVIDQPDLRILGWQDQRTRLQSLIGTDVYSNKGARIGEIEDFVLARGGFLFALVDYADGEFTDVIELRGEDAGDAVIPWNEIRMMERSDIMARRPR